MRATWHKAWGGMGGGAEAGTSPLYNGAFVLNPEAGAPLMGLNGALGEAFHVLGQHLFLVAIGCISLEVRRALVSPEPSTFTAQRCFEWPPQSPASPTLAFSKCSTTFCRMGA